MSDQPSAPETALVQLRRRVDAHFAAAVARSPADFACREGCSGCCGDRISVFAVEAVLVRDALARLAASDPSARRRVRQQAREEDAGCPLLLAGRCSIYASRPLICRSHGLPVAREDDDGVVAVACCPLNFADPNSPPPRESILSLEALNRPLATIAHLWDGRGARVSLVELALAEESAASTG